MPKDAAMLHDDGVRRKRVTWGTFLNAPVM